MAASVPGADRVVVQNLERYDPFADLGDATPVAAAEPINIRLQQRNGRKTLTTVEGLPGYFDREKLDKFAKVCKKTFSCGASYISKGEFVDVLQLQGDHRDELKALLMEAGIKAENLKVHGF